MSMKELLNLPLRLVSKIARTLRARVMIRQVTQKSDGARIVLSDAMLPVRLIVEPSAKFILNGRLTFESYLGRREQIYVKLGRDSTLLIDGDFNIGPGCRIVVEPGASLSIGGRRNENLAGLTENSQIMVRKSVRIGSDLICSWHVFITDSDWHESYGKEATQPTIIGDHVWITPNCSILKGSNIGNGCILATGAVTHCDTYPDNCLLGGQPARVLARNRRWSR